MAEPINIEPVSGFPEWLPNLRLVEEEFIHRIREQYQLYGFAPIETPAVERMEVLTSKGGIQRQIYTLGRPQEGESDADTGLGLHFDLTVPLARYVVQNAEKLVFPFRRYQIQKVWRGERAQRGRFREFYQCDVDIVGRNSLDLIHDAEIPCVINSAFDALGIPNFRVHMSNRKVLRDLLESKQADPAQLEKVLRVIDKSHRDGAEKTRERLEREQVDSALIPSLLTLIASQSIDEAREEFRALGAPTNGLDELQTVMESAVSLGMPPHRLRPDFSIARGLDYYTGTIYETFVVGNEDWGSICSGGRYDDLASFFTDQKYPGVGISIGLTRLFNLLVNSGKVDVSRATPAKVLVTMQDRGRFMHHYLELGRSLRAQSISTEIFLDEGALRDQIGYAASKGITFAVIAGESEIEAGTVAVRDLRTRKQETIPSENLSSYILDRL